MLINGFNSAINGIKTAGAKTHVTANNIANTNTPAFKGSRINTASLQGGAGSTVVGTSVNQTQGAPLYTGNGLDAAIAGAGFFKVTNGSGQTGFTRAGSFKTDSQGKLTDANGNLVKPPITIPANASGVAIEKDGNVTASVNGTRQSFGQIPVYTFQNPGGLTQGGGNLLFETSASGQPIQGVAGAGGAGEIIPASTESGNVDLGSEMVNLIQAKNELKANTKVIKATDEMLGSLLDIKS